MADTISEEQAETIPDSEAEAVKTARPKTRKKPAAAEQESAPVDTPKPIRVRDIDPDQYVTVRNGFQGRLIYRSPRTGEMFDWEKFGDEQEMSLQELSKVKNSYKKFFINNWFIFDEDWIVDYLGVKNYYKNAVPIDRFDELFTKSADELADILSKLSEGQKRSIAYRARQLIAENGIDSRNVILTLEEQLGVDLIEK